MQNGAVFLELCMHIQSAEINVADNRKGVVVGRKDIVQWAALGKAHYVFGSGESAHFAIHICRSLANDDVDGKQIRPQSLGWRHRHYAEYRQ